MRSCRSLRLCVSSRPGANRRRIRVAGLPELLTGGLEIGSNGVQPPPRIAFTLALSAAGEPRDRSQVAALGLPGGPLGLGDPLGSLAARREPTLPLLTPPAFTFGHHACGQGRQPFPERLAAPERTTST